MSNGISKQLIQVPSQISGLTNGQVLFGNSSGGISQSSKLQWNDTTGSISITGNVGIGTVSPVASLDITKVTPTFRFYDTGNNALLEYTTGGGNIHMTNSYSQGSISLGSAGVLDRLWLDKNGKVGIGTTAPTGLLDIVSATTAAYHTISNSSLSFLDTGVSGATTAAFDTNADFVWRTKTYANRGGNTYAADLMKLTATGKLGIGTTNPAQPLHVIGTIKVGLYTYMTEPNGGLATVFCNNMYKGVTNNTIIRNNTDAGNYINMRYDRGIIFGTGITSTPGTEVSDSYNERMRIDNAGNVGIGTTSPSSKLHVIGGVRQQNVTDGSDGFLFYNSVGTLMGTLYGFGSSYFAIQAQAGVGRLEFGSFGYFRWMAGAFSNTEVMRLDNSGKLGIGLTSPTASLHIKAGTATAGNAPLKLTAGTVMTTPEDGAFEFDGTNLYFTVGGIRKTVTLV